MQERQNSIDNALELHLSGINPSVYSSVLSSDELDYNITLHHNKYVTLNNTFIIY